MNTHPYLHRGLASPNGKRPSVNDTIRLQLGQPPEPLSWRALTAIARIIITPDDRPIRTIVTGRRNVTTGNYSSTKCGRSLPFEGMNEQAFIMHSEVDTRVVSYRVQPFRVEFVLDGVQRIYIADSARLLDDDRIEIIEVKNDRRALKDPDYASKLAMVRDVCARLGWAFRVVVKEQLVEPKPFFRNVVEVQSRRQAAFDPSHSYAAIDLIERMGGQAPLGKLAEAIGERRQGRVIAKAMMVARLVKIDLSRLIDDDSAVGLVTTPATQGLVGGVA